MNRVNSVPEEIIVEATLPKRRMKHDKYHFDFFKKLIRNSIIYGYDKSFKLIQSENNSLIISRGLGITGYGDIIHLKEDLIISQDALDKVSRKDNYIYIYIKLNKKEEKLYTEKDNKKKHSYTVISSEIEYYISSKIDNSSELLYLGRIFSERKTNNYEDILKDVNFTYGNSAFISNNEKEKIQKTLERLAKFFNSLLKYKIYAVTMVSSTIQSILIQLIQNVAVPNIYYYFKQIHEVIKELGEMHPELKKEEVWKNVNQLINDFDYSEEDKHNKNIDFYKLDLDNKHSFFITVLNHFEQISKSIVDMEQTASTIDDENTPFILIGRGEEALIKVDEDKYPMVSNRHLLIEYKNNNYYAKDISRYGTTRNGKKMTKNAKMKIDIHDTFTLAGAKEIRLTDHREVLRLINSEKKDFLMVGIDPNCDFVIDEEKGYNKGVSNEHLRIYIEDETIYVEDNKSTNGTYFNKRKMKIKEKRKFNPLEDELILGEYVWDIEKNSILKKFYEKDT